MSTQDYYTDDDIHEMKDKIFQRVDYLIDKFGPRLTGSKACLDTADSLYDEIKDFSHQFGKQEFDVHPDAFLGWVSLLSYAYYFSIPFLLFGYPIVGALLMTLGNIIIILEFFFYKEFTDKFYPLKKGKNVYGVINPTDSIEQTVILSGHHDSAKIFTLLYEKPSAYIPLLVLSYVFAFLLCGICIYGLFYDLSIYFRCFMICGLYPLYFFLHFPGKQGTPGAGDNLISSSMAIEIGKYFSQKKLLKHTQIIVLSFDSEEAGLRGSRAFYQHFKDDFKGRTIYNLNVDCPYFVDDLVFLTTDLNCTRKLSKELVNELISISNDNGYKAHGEPMHFLMGATDAAEAAKIGIHTTTILGIPWKADSSKKIVYHTPEDISENIEPEIINAITKIVLSFIKKVENNSFCIC